MSKRAFTEKEKELLSKNKFVKHVGDRGITYTKEYKIYFLNEKKQGKSAYEIFEGAGFDTELLGFKRITSFDSGSIPPVSINVKSLPLQLVSAYILSLVTPGVSCTIDILFPTK